MLVFLRFSQLSYFRLQFSVLDLRTKMTYLFKQTLMKSASIIKILFLIATVSLVGSGQLFAPKSSLAALLATQYVAHFALDIF